MSQPANMNDKNFKHVKSLKMKKKDRICKICSVRKGMIRKYNLWICRRCFKDNAQRLGFEKYS